MALTSVTERETPEEAVARIQSMGFCKNDMAVIMAFNAAGIPAEDIDPRHNVLTFRAWKGAGRQVARGAKSVGVTVWIPRSGKRRKADAEPSGDGEKKRSGGMVPKTARLFHISQTIPLGAEKGTRPAAWQNPELVREGTYEPDAPAEDESCTCPMVGVVTNVACPIHGGQR